MYKRAGALYNNEEEPHSVRQTEAFMFLPENLSFYGALSASQRERLRSSAREHFFARGAPVYDGDCTGLLLVQEGRLRVYTLSEEGKEITLYRLNAGDVCLFSASCALRGVSFTLFVSAEADTRVCLIPADVYKALSEESAAVGAFTAQLMAERFSQVMWVLDEVLSKKFDARLAALLLREREYAGGDELKLTHEQLAAHLGTVREAVSRMLKYFETEGLVSLSRGSIRLTDKEGLRELAQKN